MQTFDVNTQNSDFLFDNDGKNLKGKRKENQVFAEELEDTNDELFNGSMASSDFSTKEQNKNVDF